MIYIYIPKKIKQVEDHMVVHMSSRWLFGCPYNKWMIALSFTCALIFFFFKVYTCFKVMTSLLNPMNLDHL